MSLRVPPRVGAVLGFAAITVWIGLYLVAASAYAGYDPRSNYLSDLGHPAAAAAWAFNLAAVLGGLLYLPYSVAVGQALGRVAGFAGAALLVLANVFLVLVGIFPETSPNNLHFIVSSGFFVTLTVAAAVLAVPLHTSKTFGPMSGILAGATVAAGVALLASAIEPLWEHVAVFIGVAWSGWVASRLWLSAQK